MSSSSSSYQAIQILKLEKTMSDGITSLQLSNLPRLALESDEVRVRVHASALNYFDLLMLQGRYQYRPALPFTTGSEASGVIIEVGADVSKDKKGGGWKKGDEVIVGMTNGNANASEIVVSASRLIRKPKHFTFAEAASLPVGFYTTYHALVHRGKVQKGEVLLVTGAAGGMGISAIQLGRHLGMTVIGAASSDAKCAQAKAAGAHHVVNYSNLKTLKDQVSALTDGKMADVIYEVVGGDVFKECIRCIAPNGRLLVIGFASGTIPSLPVNMCLVKGFSLVGVRSGQEMFDNPSIVTEMNAEMDKISLNTQDRSLAPIVITKTLDQFRDAYKLIEKREVIGKAVILWQPEQQKAKL